MYKPSCNRDTKATEACVSRVDVGEDDLEGLLDEVDKNNNGDGGVEKIPEYQSQVQQEEEDCEHQAGCLTRQEPPAAGESEGLTGPGAVTTLHSVVEHCDVILGHRALSLCCCSVPCQGLAVPLPHTQGEDEGAG